MAKAITPMIARRGKNYYMRKASCSNRMCGYNKVVPLDWYDKHRCPRCNSILTLSWKDLGTSLDYDDFNNKVEEENRAKRKAWEKFQEKGKDKDHRESQGMRRRV